MVLTGQCCDSGTVRVMFWVFGVSGLAGCCSVSGEGQKHAAYGVGWSKDTSPRNGGCTATCGCWR